VESAVIHDVQLQSLVLFEASIGVGEADLVSLDFGEQLFALLVLLPILGRQGVEGVDLLFLAFPHLDQLAVAGYDYLLRDTGLDGLAGKPLLVDPDLVVVDLQRRDSHVAGLQRRTALSRLPPGFILLLTSPLVLLLTLEFVILLAPEFAILLAAGLNMAT